MAKKNLEFSKRLEKIISYRKTNKKRVAEAIGITPSAMGWYVNDGRTPEAPILYKLAKFLNVRMEYLLEGVVELTYKREFDSEAQAMYRTSLGSYWEEDVIEHIAGDPPKIKVYPKIDPLNSITSEENEKILDENGVSSERKEEFLKTQRDPQFAEISKAVEFIFEKGTPEHLNMLNGFVNWLVKEIISKKA